MRKQKTANQNKKKEKKIQKNDDSVWSLWCNFRCTNICIMGVPEEEREQENLFEKMTANFLNLVKEIDIQVQEVQRVPKKMNPKRPTPRHVIIKMLKVNDKEGILKVAR